jgi:hypothetical protein
MRPGIVGIHAIAEADFEEPAHYKIYALSWALSADFAALWNALCAPEGEQLWRPSARSAARNEAIDAARAAARRRRAPV